MEDETRMVNQPASTPDDEVTIRSDPGTTTSPGGGAAASAADPETARAMIEKTRARMSETIDEIEDVLIRKKEQIQDRLDILAPVRERPLPSLGIALGSGLLLGLITGGGKDEDNHDDLSELEERAERWERRARRLLRIAQEQEEELAALSGGKGSRASVKWAGEEDDVEDRDNSAPSPLSRLGDEIADRVAELLTGAVRGLFGGGSGPS